VHLHVIKITVEYANQKKIAPMVTNARTKVQVTTIATIAPAEIPSSSSSSVGTVGVGVTLGDIGGVVITLGGIVISATTHVIFDTIYNVKEILQSQFDPFIIVPSGQLQL